MAGRKVGSTAAEDPLGRDSRYHRLFGLKAAQEAGRVLRIFERDRPNDDRPRRAVEAIRAWATGKRELGMTEVRALSLGAHAAARAAPPEAARFAARAAGQAVATWHVPTHALAVFAYACKAAFAVKEERRRARLGPKTRKGAR